MFELVVFLPSHISSMYVSIECSFIWISDCFLLRETIFEADIFPVVFLQMHDLLALVLCVSCSNE